MDYGGFLREVERGNVPPVALLHGDEPRLLDDALAKVSRALFSDPSLLALNREVFDGGEAPVDEIIRAALTLPSLAPARLVAVKSVHALPAKAGGALREYSRDPNPCTRLVLLAGESLDAGHWLRTALPPASVIAVPRLTGRGLLGWLQARAREEGRELTEGAAQLLVRWAGEDLTALSGELEKALLFAGSRSITEEHIQGVVGEHRVLRTFELTDAVERGETGRALALLESLLASGEEPLAILGTLTRQVRTAWQVGEWRRQGKPVEEIAALLRRPSFAVQALSARAAALPAGDLPRALRRCWEVEGKLKSGGRPRAELTVLVADLCRAG
jgi:DNA polymerase III subunit delta